MKNVNEMSVDELSRWYALYEAVNLIADECEERNIDFETLNLEPLSLRKYIEKTSDIFGKKVIEEQDRKIYNTAFQLKHAHTKPAAVVHDIHS